MVALRAVSAADPAQLGYVGHQPGKERDSDEWHTPDSVIQAVKAVLGEIDLDPFSCAEANARIQAAKILTKETNALRCEWGIYKAKTLYMNPPYSARIISMAIQKLLAEWQDGAFQEGILLVNNSTDTAWFHSLSVIANAMTLTRGRISFVSPAIGKHKQVSSNTRGQAIFYFGRNSQRFIDAFGCLGRGIRLNPYVRPAKKTLDDKVAAAWSVNWSAVYRRFNLKRVGKSEQNRLRQLHADAKMTQLRKGRVVN